ncbi:MAG TPA: hypothetical protein VK543_12940 [Puia sp.]|nr:hypothetical protein [Puia sp.]
MKFHAFILLLAASVYVTETLTLPLTIYQKSQQFVCCGKMGKTNVTTCHQHKNEGKKESSDCDVLTCWTCPLAYLSTFQPVLTLDNQPNPQSEYPVIECNWTSEYTCKSWKPPDVS